MIFFWLLPLLIGLIYAELRNRRHLRRLIPELQQRPTLALRLLPDGLTLVALALVLIALRPSLTVLPANAPGPAIALVVDVSSSMGVTDQQPDRLARAKHELLALIDNLPNASFSLIPFAGEAVLQVPLTKDRAGMRFFINNLHTGLISSLGSAPEEAIVLAKNSLTQAAGERMIILITDGERTIAEQPPLLSDTIPVYCIMTGTTTGGQVGKLRSAISRADPERLADIARQTAGQIVHSNLLTPVVLNLPLEQRVTDSLSSDRTDIAIAGALFLLLLRWVPTIISLRRAYVVSLLLLSLLVGCQSDQATSSSHSQFDKGLLAAYNHEIENALSAFSSSAKQLDGRLRGTALFNQGTLLLETGQVDAAVGLLEQALILIPGDAAIIDNLLLALEKHAALSTDSDKQTTPEGSGDGAEMSPQQARRLIDSVQLDPTAPPTDAAARQPTVLKEW